MDANIGFFFFFLVSEETTSSNPHTLINEEGLRNAVKNDLGKQWELQDFEIKDFTNKGDNYMSAVTSVSCTATCNGNREKLFYVAKLNPLRQMRAMDDTLNEVFIREGVFFTDVAIKLNKILKSIQYPKINFPECIYHNFEKRQEILLCKDLRQKGYKMFDRRIGMDVKHSELLLKELAKLHASSHIFKNQLGNKSVLEIYPFLKDKWLEPDNESREIFAGFLKQSIGSSIQLLEKFDGYDKQREWLVKLQDKVADVYIDLIKYSPEKMKIICHGDCWNNNVVFRYDDEGNPKEITLLDLQICRYASLGLDLNYFFYTSLTGDNRRRYQDQFLSVYFKEFSNVITTANMEMPFSEDEFREEVREKELFGIISGLLLTPLMVCETQDVPEFNDVKDEDVDEFYETHKVKLIEMMGRDVIMKTRFLSILKDVLDKGIMDR